MSNEKVRIEITTEVHDVAAADRVLADVEQAQDEGVGIAHIEVRVKEVPPTPEEWAQHKRERFPEV